MNQKFSQYLRSTLFILDLIVLNLVYLFNYFIFSKSISESAIDNYQYYWLISNITWIILSVSLGTYAQKLILSFKHAIKRTFQVYIIYLITILLYLFFTRELFISRFFIISTIGFFAAALLFNRFIFLGILRYYKNSDFMSKKILILGYNETAKKLTDYFEEEGMNIKILGYVEDEWNVRELSNYPIMFNRSDTLEIAKELNVHEIFSTITPDQDDSIYDLMRKSEEECIRFKIVPDLSIFLPREIHIEYFGELPILSLRKEPLDEVGNRIKKRVLDVIVSLLVLIFILSWLMPILGVLIWIESGRPIFFKQLRTGKNNISFNCLKFRSMKVNKEANQKQAQKDDMRITKVGKFIRKTSLDEFPQFINVLKGEMSLVGPRPHMEKHTSDYSKIVDKYMVRQFIKPGITGWAQINGYRGEITRPEEIKMRVNKDLWYLEHWSLWLDVQILFLTVYYVFKGDEKAY